MLDPKFNNLFLHQNLQLDKFEATEFKYENTFFENPVQEILEDLRFKEFHFSFL